MPLVLTPEFVLSLFRGFVILPSIRHSDFDIRHFLLCVLGASVVKNALRRLPESCSHVPRRTLPSSCRTRGNVGAAAAVFQFAVDDLP